MTALTPLRLLGASLAGTAAYGLLEYRRLTRTYSYDTTPYTGVVGGVFPPGWSSAGRVSTVVTVPPRAALADPLGTYLSAFYSTWTLRLEGFTARWSNYSTRLPAYLPRQPGSERYEFCSGLFKGVYSDPTQVAMFWSLDASDEPAFCGIQVQSARVNGNNQLEISFGGREVPSPYGPTLTRVLYWFHRTYTIFLVDRAKSRLEKWAREGK